MNGTFEDDFHSGGAFQTSDDFTADPHEGGFADDTAGSRFYRQEVTGAAKDSRKTIRFTAMFP